MVAEIVIMVEVSVSQGDRVVEDHEVVLQVAVFLDKVILVVHL